MGRDQAVNLGISYTRNTLWILLWIAALVATATAVVGKLFGLLAASLANHFSPSVRHSVRLPMTVCVGGILLVGGQTVFEHFLGMKAVLSVVVEFAGGLVFLYLVLKHKNDGCRLNGSPPRKDKPYDARTFTRIFDRAPTLTVQDPLAAFLGAAENGILTYRYADAVRLCGHSCPTVAGAYLMVIKGLKALYGEELPERGGIEAAMQERATKARSA